MRADSVTAAYTAAHEAFRIAAIDHGLNPFDVRVLVAIAETGGPLRQLSTHEISHVLQTDGSAVRRSTSVLRLADLVEVDAMDGGVPRRGVVNLLTLTARGRRLVDEALSHVDVVGRVATKVAA